MKPEPQEIEVEVIEAIDSVPVRRMSGEEAEETRPTGGTWGGDWQAWQGRMRTRRVGCWWPLWILLGLVVVGFLLLVGLIAAFCRMIYRMISTLFR